MVWKPDDLFYDTREMIERIRPKQRYDIAIVAVATVLAFALVWAADLLQPHRHPPYVFIRDDRGVVVGDATTGEVAFCRTLEDAVVCSESDSAHDAMMRRLDAEVDAY